MTPQWRKSSHSSTSGGECVELARLTDAVGVRDSKNPAGGHLSMSREHFAALVSQVKHSDLGL